MKVFRLLISTLILTGALMLSSGLAHAKKEYTAKEKKGCAYCHVTATSKELNDAGKYYEKNKTLEGFKPAEKK
jgi:hypothetical protein